MKNYTVTDSVSKEKIIEIVNRLGEARLTSTSHLHHKFGDIKIIDAALQYSREYSDGAQRRPAVRLIEVVLAANRNYTKAVKPHVDRIERATDLKTFDQLNGLIENSSRDEFFKFFGHRDDKKVKILIEILHRVTMLRAKYSGFNDDFDLMRNWAKDVDIRNYEQDIIGGIKNVGLAIVQHLRMTFGYDTVKPDQRVKEVLHLEFNQPKLNNVDTVIAVEEIAKLTELRTLVIDQVFVNYGAGYYSKVAKKFSSK